MKYIVTINNEERLDNGEEDDLATVTEEVGELLRSGYFEVEKVEEAS